MKCLEKLGSGEVVKCFPHLTYLPTLLAFKIVCLNFIQKLEATLNSVCLFISSTHFIVQSFVTG